MYKIAPDTHIIQCSVKLGVITATEAETLSKDQISERWRTLLASSGIDPIEHAPSALVLEPEWVFVGGGVIKL